MMGDLSPLGIGANKWWHPDHEGSLDLLESCLKGVSVPWFASVQDSAEWGRWLEKYGSISNALQMADPEIPTAILPLASPALDIESWRGLMRGSVAMALTQLGLNLRETERQLAFVRERGEFIDVVEPVRVSNGVHTYFNVYVSTSDFWKIRRELRGLLIQTNGGEVGVGGLSEGVRCHLNSDLANESCLARLVSLVAMQGTKHFQSIADRQDFLDVLSHGWETTLGLGLRRYWSGPNQAKALIELDRKNKNRDGGTEGGEPN
jgi:hypothetical protein